MAFGSMAPPLMQMPAPPPMQDTSLGASGSALLKALMSSRGGAPGAGGAGGAPPLFGANGGLADIMKGGMGNGMLAKLFPPSPAAPGGAAMGAGAGGIPGGVPIDPNTGMPVTADVLAGAAMPDLGGGGMGMSPTAITGLW